MTEEEIRIRSTYLFLACSQAVEQFKDRLVATFPHPPLSSTLLLDKLLRRELGLLFRYWATRKIWERLESNEADAKDLNLAVLRLFVEGFNLPKDGSGLRYAELSTPAEEARELGHRVTDALGMEYQPLLTQLQSGIVLWRDSILKHTIEALERPTDELTAKVKQWAARTPEPQR